MAVLKYKNGGEYVSLTNYTVTPLVPEQTIGYDPLAVMSQKAVTDALSTKVNNSELNGKIADAIQSGNGGVKEAFDDEVRNAISGDGEVKQAIADIVSGDGAVRDSIYTTIDTKLENYTDTEGMNEAIEAAVADKVTSGEFNTYKGEVTTALNGKADAEHTHEIADVNGLGDALDAKADVTYVNTTFVSADTLDEKIKEVVEDELSPSHVGDSPIVDAVETIIENYVSGNSSVIYTKEEVNTIAEGKADKATTLAGYGITDAYTKSEADAAFQAKGDYAAAEHTHDASAITDFNDAVGNAINDTQIINQITESIEGIVEKYIYGETPSASATVITSENMEEELGDYAKKTDIPTQVSAFENDAEYVASGDVDTLVAAAITSDDTVKSAINNAIANAIDDADVVKEAISGATANFFNDVEYKKTPIEGTSAYTYEIDFKNGSTVLKSINVDDFVIDGMVDDAVISGSDLVITFNDDASGKTVSIPLAAIFDPSNYLTAAQIAETYLTKADAATEYANKNEVEINYVKTADLDDKIKTAIESELDPSHTGDTYIVDAVESIIENYVSGDTVIITESELAEALESYSSATEVTTALEGKANAVHGHVIADVEGLQTALDGKAASAHTHEMSEINGLATELTNYVTSTELTTEYLSAYTTSADVQTIVNNYSESEESDIITVDKLTEALEPYWTSAETKSAIDQAVEDAGGITPETVQGMIDSSISGKANTADVYTQSAVNTLLEGKANTATTLAGYGITDAYTKSEADAAFQAKGSYAAANHTHAISAVTGLQTALDGKAAANHTHNISDINNLDVEVGNIVASAVTANTTAVTNIVSAVTASTNYQTVSGTATSALSKAESALTVANSANTTATAAKAVTDFYEGHNSRTTLANIPTTKRLVIATGITSSTNALSLNGSLADGRELHIIVNGTSGVAITIPSAWVTVSDAITIGENGYCEINIISDGTTLYVRGA